MTMNPSFILMIDLKHVTVVSGLDYSPKPVEILLCEAEAQLPPLFAGMISEGNQDLTEGT